MRGVFASLFVFLAFSIFSIELTQAQVDEKCNEGYVGFGKLTSVGGEKAYFLMECQSGTLDLLPGQKAARFFEQHKSDPTFVSRMALLDGCEFEACLRAVQK